MMKTTDFARYLSHYLGQYLPGVRGMSVNSIKAYRDTFTIFIRYCEERKAINRTKLSMDILTKDFIVEFLNWLEEAKGVSISTRNARLAAFRSFINYVTDKDAGLLLECQKVLSIPVKKSPKKTIAYLTPEGMRLLLSQPNQSNPVGRRDLALLALMYDTGARVQEIADLCFGDIRETKPYTVKITGKGSKTRIVPMSQDQMNHLLKYMKELKRDKEITADTPLFCNRQGNKLTRAGISFILKKYLKTAKEINGTLIPDEISCHSLRHTKAMHLLQADVPLIYIRDLLGHENVTTTEIYARIDSKKKRDVLQKAYKPLSPDPVKDPSWIDNSDLMEWLKSL